ncbi:hypothetical protein WH297_05960 [Ochrobactrum vermis]|uniref:Helix-turn-helix domain-containing protein n=1 Tax=Ochrobactrum vermis TaxID=1827297 RepID=A0ABU8PAK2_9HYPH|nr:hypothetical protein [Ochrobactrum vermis]
MTITPAEYVITKLGGLTKTARACGKPVSTVQGWKERGTIPQTHWSSLKQAAEVDGVSLEYADFVDHHPSTETATGSPSERHACSG